jgi:hypothetical protein
MNVIEVVTKVDIYGYYSESSVGEKQITRHPSNCLINTVLGEVWSILGSKQNP